MASKAFHIYAQTIGITDSSVRFPPATASFHSIPLPKRRLFSGSNLFLVSSLSSSSPPNSKGEAVLQAKTCLSSTLEKPLNNPKLTGKLKRIKQPRFRVEIPLSDDSSASLSQLAFDVFQDLPIKRKGSPVKTVILWPDLALKEAAVDAFASHPSAQTQHMDVSSVADEGSRVLNTADVAVFSAPRASQLTLVKSLTEGLYPRPVVMFNPTWSYEEEGDFGELSSFVGSFDVIYSFAGLEVRGILKKRKGAIFKCVRDGVLSGEKWSVLVEEDGQLRVVSSFKARPSIGEVENVLYNLMALNSPITKSAKFLRDLVSNVTGNNK